MFDIKESTLKDMNIFNQWQKHETVHRWIYIDNWIDLFNTYVDNPNYYIFSVFLDNVLFGEISAEIIDNKAHINLIIAPEKQGQGTGPMVLKELYKNTENIFHRKINSYIAGIYPKNIQSKKCFEKAGFIFTHNGDDDEMIYELKIGIKSNT